MNKHLRRAAFGSHPSLEDDDNEKYAQFEFDLETQRIHRELRNELKNIRLEHEINEQISRFLERRLSELDK